MGRGDTQQRAERAPLGSSMITRTFTNLCLDVASFLVMLALTATGGVMCFVLPPGTGHSRVIWGLGRHDIGVVHFYLGIAALVLLGVHVALHWDWIGCAVARTLGRSRPPRRFQTACGPIFLSHEEEPEKSRTRGGTHAHRNKQPWQLQNGHRVSSARQLDSLQSHLRDCRLTVILCVKAANP